MKIEFFSRVALVLVLTISQLNRPVYSLKLQQIDQDDEVDTTISLAETKSEADIELNADADADSEFLGNLFNKGKEFLFGGSKRSQYKQK